MKCYDTISNTKCYEPTTRNQSRPILKIAKAAVQNGQLQGLSMQQRSAHR